MEPSQELIDRLYIARVIRAREVQPDEKLLDGPRLFDRARGMMMAGIRDQFPDADDSRVREILSGRMDRLRRIEEHGLYQPLPEQSS